MGQDGDFSPHNSIQWVPGDLAHPVLGWQQLGAAMLGAQFEASHLKQRCEELCGVGAGVWGTMEPITVCRGGHHVRPQLQHCGSSELE